MEFDKIIATGGIGTGMLFLSDRQETLGRSESRLVTLSPAKDYCKQQIVLYYTASLLKNTVPVYPIGYVGNDKSGSASIEEMRLQGMDVNHCRTGGNWYFRYGTDDRFFIYADFLHSAYNVFRRNQSRRTVINRKIARLLIRILQADADGRRKIRTLRYIFHIHTL